jgi:hypothetical protein
MTFIEPIKEYIKKAIASKVKQCSAIGTLIITVIMLTPLCGLLFQCGCDWPWSGLDSKCNFYQSGAEHQCPWCTSLMTGILSTGLAIISGVWASIVYLCPATNQHSVKEVLTRIVFGGTVFVLVAILTAGLAASWQGYPTGVGRYTNIKGLDYPVDSKAAINIFA